MKCQCPNCGTICNFKSSSSLKRCGKCNFIVEDTRLQYIKNVANEDEFYEGPICCTDCGRTHIFSNDERFIRCECGNTIKNPNFQTKETNLKKDERSFKESIQNFFACSFLGPIGYVIFFWIIGGLLTIAGCDKESIRGWFFAENTDPLRGSLFESICNPIFFILLLIGFTGIGFSEVVKNEKIKSFFGGVGAIFILILFLGGCINGCKIQSGFEKRKQMENQYKKHYENSSMIATHMTVYHPYITKIDLGKIRVSSWSGKIDCDYCDHLNKIKGNY
jgi:hypothetical protein